MLTIPASAKINLTLEVLEKGGTASTKSKA